MREAGWIKMAKCKHIFQSDWQGWRCIKCGKPKGKDIDYDKEYNMDVEAKLKRMAGF